MEAQCSWSRRRRRRRDQTLLSWTTILVVLATCFVMWQQQEVLALRPASLPRMVNRDYARLENVQEVALGEDPKSLLDFRDPSSLLSRILIPRVPDSAGNAKVRKILIEPFKRRGSKWHVEEHKFKAQTPVGQKEMTNVIITLNNDAPRKLVLAAHHDSKLTPQGFVGATDSAVPCAIIVDTALTLEKALEKRRHRQSTSSTSHHRSQELGLQVIFFDGEEAYIQWTQSDSVYGSRALAQHWTNSFFQPRPQDFEKRRNAPGYGTMRMIDAIDHFVLLDLLGTSHPHVPSYFFNTHWLHAELRSAEQRLDDAGLLFPVDKSSGKVHLPPPGGFGTPMLAKHGQHSFFPEGEARFGGIDDDHRPFLQSGVPILHLIPSPFPSVWHQMSDDVSALDWPTIHAWAMIMRVFIVEYFGVQENLGRRDGKNIGETSGEAIVGRSFNDFVSFDVCPRDQHR